MADIPISTEIISQNRELERFREVLMKITEKIIAKWEEMHQAAVPQLAHEVAFA